MNKYRRSIKKKINEMPDFELIEITQSKNLKIQVHHKSSMTDFYIIESITPKDADVVLMNIQDNVQKIFDRHISKTEQHDNQ